MQGLNNQKSGLPIDQIKNMRAQGLDNNQIIQNLQREGYSSSDIFDAMNQADMPSQPSSEITRASSSTQNNTMSRPTQSSQSGQYLDDPAVEEMIEAVIDEKWNEFLKDLTKLIEWKNATQKKITGLEQQFEDLQREFDKIHSALIGKVEEYDKNIQNVGADVKAMEKVFGKVIPEFTENVSELGRIAQEMNKAKKKLDKED